VNNPLRKTDRSKVTFRVAPNISKPEIKDYLSKIYGLDIWKVNTMNYDGKIKTRSGKPGVTYQERSYKKVIVTLTREYMAKVAIEEKLKADKAKST